MAFDRTNPADLAALKTEVETDPIGMGYSTLPSDQVLVKTLNDPASNVGGEVATREFDPQAMLDALVPTDLGAQQTNSGASAYFQGLIAAWNAGVDVSSYKAKFRSMFGGNSDTVTALDLQTSPLSRAEVLFGQSTVITMTDWAAARDS